jgi:hypothetical protein
LRTVLVPGATAFVAADPQSTHTKRLILASFPAVRFLARDADAEATRSTVDGVVDALADNYVLSACRAIIPREIGASTFHDMAVARAAFGFAWPRNETLAYHYARHLFATPSPTSSSHDNAAHRAWTKAESAASPHDFPRTIPYVPLKLRHSSPGGG